jgi:hypothetical protein
MGAHSSAPRHGRATVDTSDGVEVYARKYNERALMPTLRWIQSQVHSNPSHAFDYTEVMAHLGTYEPRYGCDIVFAKSALLPALEAQVRLAELPASLIVVLNSLYLTKNATVRLVDVQDDGWHLVFTAAFTRVEQGRETADSCQYRLRNYSTPGESWLELL